jgi:D-3-phosphoglycerate dehydrogenase
MVFAIQTFNNIAPEGLNLLPKDEFAIDTEKEAQGIILRSQDLHALEFSKELLAIARAGAGTNNIPIDKATEAGVVVFNTPGANANAVKEAVIAGLLLSSRPYIKSANWAQTLTGENLADQAEKGKKQFAGTELVDKKIGVIGLGAIGMMVANNAERLGMKVIGYDPFVSVDSAWNISHKVQRSADIDELFSTCDFITIHVPLLEETKNLVNEEKIELMKDGTVLLNFARGELVDNQAVLKGIEECKISKYITDFIAEELLHQDKVIIFPHVGASTEEAEVNCAVMAAKTLKQFLETGEIKNSVNLPTVSLPLKAPNRFTLVHKNIPNMIGKISTEIAKQNINIAELINRSKGDYAYTIVDVEETPEEELQRIFDRLNEADSVLRVRLIRQ